MLKRLCKKTQETLFYMFLKLDRSDLTCDGQERVNFVLYSFAQLLSMLKWHLEKFSIRELVKFSTSICATKCHERQKK